MKRDLFDPGDEDDDSRGHHLRPEDDRCTPEKLEAFIRLTLGAVGRFPTLQEIKRQFGGLLGAYLDGWELQRRGVWQEFRRLARGGRG